ncbi:MAG: DUF5685 family protein [Clostridiales bacterium]|nr:DUF5685 family protein [Clostridiales bacterium]
MFGYIVPKMDALTEDQKRRYRQVYCGVCRELGALSGRSGRLLLSHDMTFLALLLNSLMEPEEKTESFRCAAHPLHPREILISRAVHYAAAMNLILMDLKCEDQIRDDHSQAARAERRFLKNAAEATRQEYSLQTEGIESALNALWEEEGRESPDPDRLCNLSGQMLGAAFVPEWADPFWKPALKGLGEGLGRFVYWMDAWEDLEKDRKKGHVNPLSHWDVQDGDGGSDPLKKRENLEEFVKDVLEMLMGEAAEYFESLPLEKDLDILRNVLYSGVWQRYEFLRERQEKERKKS